MQPAPPASASTTIRTPRAAALAGIVFSVLFATSQLLIGWALPRGSEDRGAWVTEDDKRAAVSLSLHLLPFAGIAFLWFIGVLRDRIGDREDRFFATVFLGSGLLFVAMMFASGAIAGALLSTANDMRGVGRVGNVWPFGRLSATSLADVYGLRMAAVFTISGTSIAARLDLVPRWLALLGYATAVVLLLASGQIPWIQLAFPAWVFVLSVHTLVTAFGGAQVEPADGRR
jgi:hypothetical protein